VWADGGRHLGRATGVVTDLEVTTVADGVHFAQTALVNWVILTDGESVVLVDAGYPRQVDAVAESVRRVGRRPEQIDAVLVTHAHVDHVGSIPELRRRHGCRVLCGAEEARHLRGEYHQVATPVDVVRNLWRPRVLPWALRVIRAGALTDTTVDDVGTISFDARLRLSGGPVPLATPGHTDGHTSYLLPDAGALVVGDVVVTGHPTVGRRGPQLLLPFFHHDLAQARDTVDRLRHVDANLVLPGHGPPQRGDLGAMMDQVLA
jgi:glyoxylase-like metal-dependent hydrolase (beta-lactamase superfamily II)